MLIVKYYGMLPVQLSIHARIPLRNILTIMTSYFQHSAFMYETIHIAFGRRGVSWFMLSKVADILGICGRQMIDLDYVYYIMYIYLCMYMFMYLFV